MVDCAVYHRVSSCFNREISIDLNLRFAEGDSVYGFREKFGLRDDLCSCFTQGQRSPGVNAGHLDSGLVPGQLAELHCPG